MTRLDIALQLMPKLLDARINIDGATPEQVIQSIVNTALDFADVLIKQSDERDEVVRLKLKLEQQKLEANKHDPFADISSNSFWSKR